MDTRFSSVLLIAACFLPANLFGGDNAKHPQQPSHTLGLPRTTYMNINNVSTAFWNNGNSDTDSIGFGRFVYPKGSGKTAFFASGFIWGGYIPGDPQVRVGGSTYRTGLQPGKILSPGIAEDPTLPKNRIYRGRPDYLTADLSTESQEEGQSQAAVRARYALDWNQWPVADGAPFEDKNGNGIYEPGIDVAGISGASQTIWFVCNDLDPYLTTSFYGSNPIGIELQVTIWAYSQPSSLRNMIFKSYLMINRRLTSIDSIYVSQWSDPDVGISSDDFAGCDSTLNLGFVYNAFSRDAMYYPLPPPAVGFSIIQGPLVPAPGQVAILKRRLIPNFRNLPMTAFYYLPSSVFPPSFASDYYALMRGRSYTTYQPFIDPTTGQRTTFALSGNPLTGAGWVDGILDPYSDRRIGPSCGPFTMAPGDTQEVVVAQMAAGASFPYDYLFAVDRLKSLVPAAKGMEQSLFRSFPPDIQAVTTYPSPPDVTVKVTADGRASRAQSISATLLRQDNSVVLQFPLYDDGTHGDSLANDKVFTNIVTISREGIGLACSANVIDSLGRSSQWDRISDRITIAGPILLGPPVVFSDNLNGDGRANPGENIRYGFAVTNGTFFRLRKIHVTPQLDPFGNTILINNLYAEETFTMFYDPQNPASYFTANIPPNYADTLYGIPVTLYDGSGNAWTATLEMRVYPLQSPVQTSIITHPNGIATGEFSILVVDNTAVRNHQYIIRGVDSINAAGDAGFTLKDSTDGRILLLNQAIPDSLGHDVPVTDGFRVKRGSIETTFGMKDWAIPNGQRKWTWIDADALSLQGFNGAIGWDDQHVFFGTTVSGRDLRTVLIKFATAHSAPTGNGVTPYGGWDRDTTTDPNMSYAYRYLRAAGPPARPEFAPYIINVASGYPYQDYKKGVPFSAWDIDANPPRRLAVGLFENNVIGGLVDGRHWPPASGSGLNNMTSRDWFFIFNRPYTGSVPDPSLMVNISNNPQPVMWFGTVNRWGEVSYQTGDEFLIIARHPPSSEDIWTFNPTIVLGVGDKELPTTFALYQNYPNPFNPSTTIQYQLAGTSNVTIRIYNLLGQEIRELTHDVQPPGTKSVVWDGVNAHGRAVATGVYFYRIEATPVQNNSAAFVQVKKMLLLR